MKYNTVIEAKQFESSVTEPVTLAEVKQWCKIELDITDENTLLTQLITAARKQAEGFLCVSLVDKTVTAVLKNELGNIELPYGPVKTITSVTDADGDTVSPDNSEITGEEFKKVKTPCDEWLKIVYTTGYTSIPDYFKTAVLNQVLYLYENRGEVSNLSPMASMLLKPHRRVW